MENIWQFLKGNWDILTSIVVALLAILASACKFFVTVISVNDVEKVLMGKVEKLMINIWKTISQTMILAVIVCFFTICISWSFSNEKGFTSFIWCYIVLLFLTVIIALKRKHKMTMSNNFLVAYLIYIYISFGGRNYFQYMPR